MAWDSLAPTEPRRLWRFVVPFVAGLTLIFGANQPLPYYAVYPGSATPVNPLVAVPTERSHPAEGSFLLTTVSLQSRPTVLQAFLGWLDPDVALLPERQILGDRTPDEFRQVNFQAIDTSKEVAVAVAMQRLGLDVKVSGQGAIVENVLAGSPAATALRAGDIIVGIAGQPVSTVEDVQAAVAARQPGDPLDLDVLGPDGARRSLTLTLMPCPEQGFNCPGGGEAVLGVALRTRDLQFTLPFDVSIESENIGGPSAGLAFTLTVIDLLTPGELTGGRPVAVTGEIDLQGNVGPIGGVGQKAAAVTDAGIEVFIVPEANAAEALEHAGPDLLIVPVADLDSALVALGRIGGDVAALGIAP